MLVIKQLGKITKFSTSISIVNHIKTVAIKNNSNNNTNNYNKESETQGGQINAAEPTPTCTPALTCRGSDY